MQVADFERFAASQKRFGRDPGACRQGQAAGVTVDFDEADTFGRLETDVVVTRQGALHEVSPNGKRGLGPAQSERGIVIETHPYDGQQLGCESDEPGVPQIVGRARLAGGVQCESVAPRAGPGSFVDDTAHHVGHEECG